MVEKCQYAMEVAAIFDIRALTKTRIKRYRIAICDAKFAVCDVTLIFCRKFCDATFACKSAIVGYPYACAQHLGTTQALRYRKKNVLNAN